MSEITSPVHVVTRFQKHLIISIMICMLMVPVADMMILQRDRNRNMVFGELFWTHGVDVYNINDKILNETYGVPADHLLTGVVNVTYEYPIVTLLFYAVVALFEPGMYGPHWLANWVLVIIAHINLILFLFLGREYWDRKWFRQIFALYYAFEVVFSVGFAKTEPLSDLLWLVSILLWKQDRRVLANITLAMAGQTKLYPITLFPMFAIADPPATIGFFVMNILLMLPLWVSNITYSSLLAHLSNSSSYSRIVTNPFFIGMAATNPIVILAPAILVIVLIFGVFRLKRVGRVVLPSRELRTRSLKTIFIFMLPLSLIFFSWVLIWYYSWFIVPIFILDTEEDKRKYCWMIFAIWAAHFAGILLNLNYFLNGPIAEFFGHMR